MNYEINKKESFYETQCIITNPRKAKNFSLVLIALIHEGMARLSWPELRIHFVVYDMVRPRSLLFTRQRHLCIETYECLATQKWTDYSIGDGLHFNVLRPPGRFVVDMTGHDLWVVAVIRLASPRHDTDFTRFDTTVSTSRPNTFTGWCTKYARNFYNFTNSSNISNFHFISSA